MIRRADEPTEAAESDLLASAGETRAHKGTLDGSLISLQRRTLSSQVHHFLSGLAGALHHQGELERYKGAQASKTPVSAAAAEMDRVRKRPRLEENPGTRCSFCKGKHRHRHDKRNCPGRRMLSGQQLLPFPPKRSSSSISHHHLVGDQQPETSN
jgi:hypothetical protein